MSVSNDLPIRLPSEDRFGLNPFALALARTVSGMPAPSGVVLGVNGDWGSGKSSAINLMLYHLREQIEADSLKVVTFNPWWFSGPEALTFAFFEELNRAIGPSLPDKVKKSLKALARGVSSIGLIAGAAANLKAPGLGELIAGTASWIGNFGTKGRTLDEEHRLISEALKEQSCKYLVVVDDIDRLAPEDVLTIFRLVKSVGRLPNVIYLLAFDKSIADRIVTERYPSEGPAYLEKIVQGSFEIPPPLVDLLRQQVVDAAVQVMGQPPESQAVRFWNVFHDVVAPNVRTPRDVTRISNQLSTTWPAVGNNVDRADFFALTALQLNQPKIYAAIRQHPDELCGAQDRATSRTSELQAEYDALFGITERSEQERGRIRIALRRLFPRLDAIWSNSWHTNINRWRRDRLIASPEHFRSYFAFTVAEDVIPRDELIELLENAENPELVTNTLRRALTKHRRTGATLASLWLEELQVHARNVSQEKVADLVSTLFRIADELDVDSDANRGFAFGNNQLRLHWLLNDLVNDGFDLHAREQIYRAAMEGASVEWACDFTERCLRPFEAKEDGDRGDPDTAIVSEPVAEEFRRICLEKIDQAAANGELARHPKIARLLFAWLRLNARDPGPVKRWTDASLADPIFVTNMARDLPSEAWSHGMGWGDMGDRVASRSVLVDYEPYRDILDVEAFEATINRLISANELPEGDLDILRGYMATPRGSHSRRFD